MVKEIKLTGELISISRDPSAEPVLQRKGLFEMEPIVRPFSWYKFGQNRAKGRQKLAKNNQKVWGFTTCFVKVCQVPAACVNL
jgi:hypothetical protein